MNKDEIKRTIGWFFNKYLWLGIIWLLVAIIVEDKYGERSFTLGVVINLISSISIAIIIASIFSYTLGTTEFIHKIRGLLEDVVVSRQFLNNLSVTGKKEALKELLKPTELERKKYANIESYYDDYVKKSLDIRSNNVRSNYSIVAHTFFDDEINKVGVRAIYSYRLFPSETGYKAIKVGFDEEDKDSICEKIIINKPDGTREVNDNIHMEEQENLGSKDRLGQIDINGLEKKFDHLDIEVHAIEYGNDHWFMYTFKALQPTDGFRLHIQCHDEIEIRKYAIFDTGNAYHVDMIGKFELMVTCHQWIKEGVGISVLLAIPHKFEEKKMLEKLGDEMPTDDIKPDSNIHVT